ncbi:MAG TPA: hypothetical protein VGM74_12520 [Burkholderiaceae bacterium]|jgi:hypothetical protein
MSRTLPRQYFAANHRAVANAIEWEEMPSLTKRLVNRDPSALARGANDSRFGAGSFESTWGETTPVSLDTRVSPPSTPFVEHFAGLSTREVNEPDVFLHFFGPNAEN